jgi:hypothetical protein
MSETMMAAAGRACPVLEEITRRLDGALARNRLRVTKCTQEAFEKLPALVSRQEFMDWTGYSDHELREEISNRRLKVYRPKGRVKARFYKFEIARIGGWKM